MPSNPFARDPAVSVGVGADTSAFSGAMDDAIGQLGSFKKAVGGAGLALGALATGALVKATQAARDWEDVMADVEKVTDPQTTEELSQGFQDLAEEIPIAAEDLAKLGEQAGKFGAEGSDEIMSFVETVGKIQTATDLSAEVAGKRFSKIAGAIGMPLSEVDKLGNSVNALADSMKTDAGEITDTATRAANTLGQQFGLGEDAVIALSASMNEVSPSSRRAASSLRRAAESLMDPKKTEDLANALGMNVDEFKNMRKENPEGLMNKVAKAMDDNGETAEELRGVLGKAATDFSKLGGQMGRTEDAQRKVNEQFEEGTSLQKEMEIRTNTFSGQMQLLRNKIGNVARSIGGQLLPHLANLLKSLNGMVGTLIEVNNRTNGAAATFGLVATAVVGFGTALASAISMVGGMSAILGALGTAFTVLTGPIGIAAVAIAGLAAAWQTNLFGIRDVTANVLGRVREVFSAALSFVRDNIVTPILNTLTRVWTRHGDKIEGELTATMNHIRNVIRDVLNVIVPIVRSALNQIMAFWNEWGDEIMAVVGFAFDIIKGTIGTVLDGILTTVRVGLALLRGDWEGAWNHIAGFVERTFEKIRGVIMGGVNAIVDYVSNIGRDDIYNAFKAVGTAVRNVFIALVDGIIGAGGFIKTLISDVVAYLKTDAKGDIRSGFTALRDVTVSVFSALKTDLIGAGGLILSMMGDIATYLRTGAADDVRSAIDTIIDGVMAAFEGLYDGLIGNSLIPEMFRDILSYARSWGTRFTDWVSNLVSDIINSYIHLYTRLADAIIPDMFRDILGTARRKGNDLARSIRRTVSDMVSSVRSGMHDMVSEVWDRLSAFKTAVESVVGAGKRKVTSKISDYRNAGGSLVSGVASGIRSGISRIRDAAGDAMSAARSVLPSSDADEGPLSDLTASGEALPETFAEGIRQSKDEVGDAIEGLSAKASHTLPNPRAPGRRARGRDAAINLTVNAERGADGNRIGREISDELRSRGFGN